MEEDFIILKEKHSGGANIEFKNYFRDTKYVIHWSSLQLLWSLLTNLHYLLPDNLI